MLEIFDGLRTITLLSILLRLLIAVACGGLVGSERAFSGSAAGMRTHILICLGATITTLTSQFMLVYMHSNTDIARLGAQVVAGVGFIGAGTIIVTRRRQIRGLTTAAGIWTVSVIGLAIGAGFYEGGILAVIALLSVRFISPKLNRLFISNSNERSYYLEYTGGETLDVLITAIRSKNIEINALDTAKIDQGEDTMEEVCAILTARFTPGVSEFSPKELEHYLKDAVEVSYVKQLG